ncbi:MAG: hypothetical protein ACI8X5_003380 [Planctomycetota bacterium]
MRLTAPFLLLVICLASCAGRSRWPDFRTQVYPEPMVSSVDPLPPGIERLYPPGPEEVIIRRLADPVQVKAAGQHAAYQLRYFDKRRRENSGTWVFVAPGGRAEVLWPTSGSRIVMFDQNTGIVGSSSRGEPNFIFREMERAVLDLTPGDQVELAGGAILTAESGPWLIERQRFEILRVRNQSKIPGEIAYRNEVFNLGPGETLDLPLLTSGGSPVPEMPGTMAYQGPGFRLQAYGNVTVSDIEGGLQVTGNGEHEFAGLGIRLRLAEGELAQFSGMGLSEVTEATSAEHETKTELTPLDAVDPD